jgi:hypothetical protein
MGYLPHADPDAKRAYQRAYYEKNRGKIIDRARADTVVRRSVLKQLIAEAKQVPCTDCGHEFPTICMDFDHTSDNKECDVADMVRRAVSPARLQAEIAKCEVVCANCHRLRTQSRRDPGSSKGRTHDC